MTTSTVEGQVTRSYPSYSRNLLKRVLLTREAAVFAALAVVYVYALVNVQFFDGPLTTYNLWKEYAPIMVMALPMTLIIVSGEIDLSVASTLGVSAATAGVLVKEHGASMPTAIVVALLLGLVLGAVNGVLVAYVGLPSLAVTIGTLALYRGIAVGLIQDNRIAALPDAWREWPTERIGSTNLPMVVVPVAVLAILFGLLLHFTSFGRGVFEIGLSAEAAHFSGVDVARTKLVLFVLSGVVSAFAGIYFTLRFGSARGDNATGYELQVIAAVLLGGVSIFGGRGRLHGVLAGVVLIGVISSALRLESVTVNVTNIIVGLLLVASVILPSVLAWTSSRLPRKAAPTAPSESHPHQNAASADVAEHERQ